MSLTLYFHPLSSFCMKALVGLYELDVPFTKQIVNLGDEAERAAFVKIWPMGKFPVLRDEASNLTVAESSIVIEYVDAKGCAAAPALFYANKVLPLGRHRHLVAYLARLTERPSFRRVLEEAEPYFAMFPG